MSLAPVVAREVGQRFADCVALANVSFTLAPGSVTGLIGVNGAGKTTLLRALAGAREPDAGRVTIGGSDPYARASRAQALAGADPVAPDQKAAEAAYDFSGWSMRTTPTRLRCMTRGYAATHARE